MAWLWYWPKGGWDFDAWKKAHPWKPIKSAQSGKHDFIPLDDWKNTRAKWSQVSDAILGTLTDKPPAKPTFEWLTDEYTREQSPCYIFRRMRYRLTDDEWGYAWLLVPKGVNGPTPTVIALHQTEPQGKDEPIGLTDTPDKVSRGLRYGVDLVERGYIVFAPDAIAFGERMADGGMAKYNSAEQFFNEQPDASVMGKMNYDVSRAIDLLETLPNIDKDRIGCIGHSHGAYGTLFAMLSDDRIKVGVISCGVDALRYDPHPERWWKMTALMPRLGFYEGHMDDTPIDFHIWLALLAPRPVFVSAGTEDAIFPNCAKLPPAFDRVADVYAQYNAKDNFQTRLFPGPHNFPIESRQAGYALLDRTLKKKVEHSRADAAAATLATALLAPGSLPKTKTYQAPETRLPFVNGEIAQTAFQGAPHLVSAVWGDRSGGRLYFWNPVTKTQAMRRLPQGSPGAYMLKTAADGNLYIGDGNGDLHRYNPATDSIETLVKGELHGITWGGCVTDRYVVWTTDPGQACVYDWRERKLVKKFSPVDALDPHSHYGHNVLAAPDGRVILFMDTPQLHLAIFDPKTLDIESIVPESVKGNQYALHVSFFDDHTLLLVTPDPKHGTQFLSYPDFKLIESIPLPQNCRLAFGHGARAGDSYYALFDQPAGSLWRISNSSRTWERVLDNWIGEETGYLGAFENNRIAAITVTGKTLSFNPDTKDRSDMQIDNLGQLDVHAMCAAPERNLIVGAPFINSSFWTIDLATGHGIDRGRAMPGSGQINQIVWDAGRHRALMSAYTAAAVTEYDPDKPGAWPVNPRLVASAAHDQQMRPLALAFDRRYVWMATSPSYGKLGGALSRIEPETGEIRVFRNIIPDQTINALALDLKKRRVYFSSEIYADQNSCPPKATTAEIAAFDMNTLKLIKRRIVRDNAPRLGVTIVLPDGRLLLHEENHFYAWNADTDQLDSLGSLPSYGPVVVDQHNHLWASIHGAIGKLHVGPTSIAFTPILHHPGGSLQLENDTLYYATNATLYATPLDELRDQLPPSPVLK